MTDTMLVDAFQGDRAEVTRRFFKVPVLLTVALSKVAFPHWLTFCEQLLSAITRRPPECSEPELIFTIPIDGSYLQVKASMGPDGEGRTCLTLMLSDER